MSRKHGIILVSVLLGLAAGVVGTLAALFHTPSFYAAALRREVDPQTRQKQAKLFVQTTLQLVDDLKHAERWSEEFSEDEVNSWLAEELHQKYADWLPAGVKEPRVRFDDDTLELAFQFQRGEWKGVVSGRLRPWAAGPNQLAIEIQSLRAGLVPIPLDEVLAEISAELKNSGWRIEWKQNNGNDVLVLHLEKEEDAGQPVLDLVQLRPQVLRIAGSSTGKGSGTQNSKFAEKPF